MGNDIVIGPSAPRMFLRLALADLLIAASLLLGWGLWWLPVTIWATATALFVLLYLASLARGLPAVEIGDEGFAARYALGGQSYKWADVEGDFEAVRIVASRRVAFRVTPEYKAIGRKLRRPPCPGYDAAFAGSYRLPPEELAALLNRRRREALAGRGVRA